MSVLGDYLKIDGKHIGMSFRRARTASGLTQKQLAMKAGLHFNTVGLLERNQIEGSVYIYLKLAQALGYSGIVFELDPAEDKLENVLEMVVE